MNIPHVGNGKSRTKERKIVKKKDHTRKRKDSLTEVSFAVDTRAKKGISLPGKKRIFGNFVWGKKGRDAGASFDPRVRGKEG